MGSRVRYRDFHIEEPLVTFGDLLLQWDWNVPKYLFVHLFPDLLSKSVANLILDPYSATQASSHSSNGGKNLVAPQLCLNFWLNFLCHSFEFQ